MKKFIPKYLCVLGLLACATPSYAGDWKALAIDPTSGSVGFVSDMDTREDAEQAADNDCSGSCSRVVSTTADGVIMTMYCTNGADDQYAAGAGGTKQAARSDAYDDASWFAPSMCKLRKVR